MTLSVPTASILVVDDTLENLRLLSTMLSEHGFEPRPVTNGRDAIEAARHAAPDLILLDITMPDMDGYETCGRLKATEGLDDVPVIFLTALSDVTDKLKAFAAGGADYVTKPFQIEEVIARVEAHLALRRARVELSRSYERLRTLEALRDDLVHMVVHDLRSPLTALIMRLQFLKGGVGEVLEGEAVEDLESAVRAAGIINRMANDLLDISRMEEGKLPIDRTPTDLVKVVEEVRASLSTWQGDRPLDVAGDDSVEASCDAGLIHRVIENLVNNAFKHTPEGGAVVITVEAGLRPRIAVLDEGPGVPVEARESIFEKFGALAVRRDRTYHSAGLGLAFCKLAVEAHGGRIGVEARDGGGSVFWFDLPGDPTKAEAESER